MSTIDLLVNGERKQVEAEQDEPLLWILREKLGLTGTKYGCGLGVCGSCTVHLDGRAARSCVTAAVDAGDRSITTIEGLATEGRLHPVQQAWIDEDVAQCGFCQPGQIMAAAALLSGIPDPSDDEIDRVMRELVCRCGTYNRIREAIRRASSGAAR